jgi:hypothetical protein
VLFPEGLRREVLLRKAVPIVIPAAQSERLMALRSARTVARQERAARPVALRRERAEAARPAVPGGSHRGLEMPAQHPARLSAAVARKARALRAAAVMAAQRLAEAMVAQRQVAQRQAEPAVQAVGPEPQQEVSPASAAQPTAAREEEVAPDVVVGRQPAVESAEVAARRREAAAVRGAAEVVQRRAAGPASVEAVRLRGAQVAAPDAEEAPQRAAPAGVRDAAGVLRRVARDEARGVLLLAAAWAGPLYPQAARLAPSARARSAHARGCLRTAQR